MMRTMRRQDLPRTGRYSFGEVAEWSNAPDSKSGLRLCRNVGSNPTLSASNANAPCGRFAFPGSGAEKPFGSTNLSGTNLDSRRLAPSAARGEAQGRAEQSHPLRQ